MKVTDRVYLLDSHTLLWLLQEPDKFGPKAQKILQEEKLWVSMATLWELALKHRNQKLKFSPAELLTGITQIDADLLAIKTSHIAAFSTFEFKHKDPFDLMLVIQSKVEGAILLTADQTLLDQNLKFVMDVRK